MGESEVLVPHSSTNTSRLASILSATITRQAALSHSSRSEAPTDLFSTPPQTLYCPGDRRVANSYSRHALQELSALREGSGRSLFEVRLEEPLALLIDLRAQAGRLLRSERPPLVCHTDVTFDRREADTQGSRHLAFAHAPADGLDYLPSQVFRVGFHPSMVPDGPVPLQTALGGVFWTTALCSGIGPRTDRLPCAALADVAVPFSSFRA